MKTGIYNFAKESFIPLPAKDLSVALFSLAAGFCSTGVFNAVPFAVIVVEADTWPSGLIDSAVLISGLA
ncbi:MAG: hypothetical protein KKH57_05055 [Candidatus Omnitrophica bacterium]|nr:hypothetical protein [Candidatus Omnitrophota bacterium]